MKDYREIIGSDLEGRTRGGKKDQLEEGIPEDKN